MTDTSSPYVITSQFSSSDPLCPLTSITVVPLSGGSAADYANNDGSASATLISSVTDPDIQI